MNIIIPDSWLREYLDTDATAKEIKQYLSLCGPSIERLEKRDNETLYHIEVTTNRVDSASVIGIAREAAAILPRFGKRAKLKKLNHLTIKPFNQSKSFPIKITVQDNLCSRVVAVVLDNVRLGPSPKIIKDRLEMMEIRALNNAVDITNYVMCEIGHPAHVFDYDKVMQTKKFVIRKAKKGEKIVSLDSNKKYTLAGFETIIDDGTGRIIDLPGIIGTANSVVSDKTKRVLFFIETNDPVQIRRASMSLGIRTNAASLNEKGIDPELAITALLKGIVLFQKNTGATISSRIFDYYPKPYKAKRVSVSKEKTFQYLGSTISDAEIRRIFSSLEFKPEVSKDRISVTIPSFRKRDINIAEDLIEELARIYGYHNIVGNLPTGEIPVIPYQKELVWEKTAKAQLKGWGYTEIYSYSFVSKSLAVQSGFPLNAHLTVSNPLTEETQYLRRSLLPSLLQTVEKNQNRRDQLFLFEIANVYNPQKNSTIQSISAKKGKKLPHEQLSLAVVNQQSFVDLKGVIEALFENCGIKNAIFEEDIHGMLHEYQTAVIKVGKEIFGYIGKLHPKLTSNLEMRNRTYLAEIDMEKLSNLATTARCYIPIPKHPTVLEDFAFKFPPKTYIGIVIAKIETLSKLISFVEILETYKDTTTLRITFQHPTKNLSKQDVEKVRSKIIKTVQKDFKGKLKEVKKDI